MDFVAKLAERYDLGTPLVLTKMTHNSGSDVFIVNDTSVVKIFPEETDPLMPAKEIALCTALHDRMPTPKVIGYSDSEHTIPRPYIVLEKMSGKALEFTWDTLSEPQRSEICEWLGLFLATIHATANDVILRALKNVHASIDSDTLGIHARARRALDTIETQKLLTSDRILAIRHYFERHATAEQGTVLGLCHGSYRFGNILADEATITGVLDWEDATFGDTLEELALTLYRTIPERFHSIFLAGYTERKSLTSYPDQNLYASLFYLEHLPNISAWTLFPGKQAYYKRETERILETIIGTDTFLGRQRV